MADPQQPQNGTNDGGATAATASSYTTNRNQTLEREGDQSFDEYIREMSDSVHFESDSMMPPSPTKDSSGGLGQLEEEEDEDEADADDDSGRDHEAGNNGGKSGSSGGGGSGHGSSKSRKNHDHHWTPKRSFLAESPYFNAFVEKEMHEIAVVTDILNDISNRTKAFTKYGSLMAEATHTLSLSCRLRREEANQEPISGSTTKGGGNRPMDAEIEKRRQALGPEMADLLGIMGETLEEIAHAQLTMCKIFDATLSKALESFVQADLRGVNMLKSEAENQTVAAEQMMFKYMTGKPTMSPNSGGDDNMNDSKTDATSSSSSGSSTPTTKSTFSKLWSREGRSDRGNRGTPAVDPALDQAINAANWRLNLEEIRLNQATAELKRFQFTKLLLDVKNRRNLELSEGVVSSAHGFQAYLHSSLDRMAGSLNMMTKIENRQRDARKSHQKIEMPMWLERMNLIVRVLSSFQTSTAEAAQTAYDVAAGDPVLIDKQITNVERLEKDVQFWEVPAILAKSSRYRREAPMGVLHEGWLYQKVSSMLSYSSWNRRWFMLKKDGIYCLETSAELKRENTGHSTSKVKICDVVLCTVREIPNDNSGRFRFELIAPRQKPLLLMARGPTEMQAWVKAIRDAVEKQLVHGDPECMQLNQNIGKMKKDRRSTEIAMTVFKDQSPLALENAIMEEFAESGEDEDEEIEAKRSPLVKQVFAENATCADCGKAKPDWVSLNLGILVCLECSGVHRSLGVHVSKVRSLTLDALSETEARLFLALGNENANKIWEERLPSGAKLEESADRDTRMKWIKSKYLEKEFLASSEGDDDAETRNRELYKAAKSAQLLDVATALAHGADVEWKNEGDNGKTALHACAVSQRESDDAEFHSEWLAIECAELLIQNGASMNALDHSSHTVLDHSVLNNGCQEMIEYLSTKLE